MVLRALILIYAFTASVALGASSIDYCKDKFSMLLSSGRTIEDTALQAQTNYFSVAKRLKEVALDTSAPMTLYFRTKTVEQLLSDMQDFNEFRCQCPKYCRTVYVPLSKRGIDPSWWTVDPVPPKKLSPSTDVK